LLPQVRDAIARGAIGFDAVKHLILCRLERRPPRQDHWVIRRRPDSAENTRDRLVWGFKSPWMAKKGLAPEIIARTEGVASSGMFKASYAERRCLVPLDSFFEWRKIKGPGPKQPYAVGLKSGERFGIAAIWTGYQTAPDQWVHNFAVITARRMRSSRRATTVYR
jgi:putative SOS response-associated peptidase YedK